MDTARSIVWDGILLRIGTQPPSNLHPGQRCSQHPPARHVNPGQSRRIEPSQEAPDEEARLLVRGAALVVLALAGGVIAASPQPTQAGDQIRDRDTIPTILGLTQAEVMALRHDGLSLAQIAERQKVDPQKLVDALKAQWTERIDVRVANGAITAGEATTLKAQVDLRAKDMVYKVTMGGMRGVAVGAGPTGIGRGMAGMGGSGTCDGSGPHGAASQ